MNIFLLFLLGLFVFVGLFIGYSVSKYKDFFVNMFYGYFIVLVISNILPNCFSLLSTNYHNTTFIYLILMLLVGFVIMIIVNLICCTERKNSNISFIVSSIVYSMMMGFYLFNNIYYLGSINYILFIFNLLYSVIIGSYISCLFSKKYAFILSFVIIVFLILGGLINTLFVNIPEFVYGLIFSLNLGVLVYFISSFLGNIFKMKSSKSSMLGLIIGMLVVILGVLL